MTACLWTRSILPSDRATKYSLMAASHSESLASRFASKCERLQGSVDFSKNALLEMYNRQLARDAKVVEALKEDVATLQRALSRLDADVGPQLDRIGLNARQQLLQPPKVVLVKAPTAAEQAAALEAALFVRPKHCRFERFSGQPPHEAGCAPKTVFVR